MEIEDTTWKAGGTTDHALLAELPAELQAIIGPSGGFILHHGAIHFRGCVAEPEWNSLRAAWQGETSLASLYPVIGAADIPFAQDQMGDQYLLRGETVLRLDAETGELAPFAESLLKFMEGIGNDIQEYLNVGLAHELEPGKGLLAYPPFCMKESGEDNATLNPVPVSELILFHADLARQIANLPEGGQVEFRVTH
ncbi:MAG: hypothetical protein EOP85_22225 [Verrucomicrobiaceae bacterium]|nr:MAG: hypothetical protein EOP85_22225 [Verrucomicrobiaceae bacterium]